VLFFKNKNKGRFERAPKTDNEQIHTHTDIKIFYTYIFPLILRELIYILDCLIVMDTYESQNNRQSEELAAKVSRLKHVSH
jgi:hypothetical protein